MQMIDDCGIDSFYDCFFAELKDLRWWPWVGSRYRDTDVKTFILGESAYKWNAPHDYVEKRMAAPDHLRITHQTNALQFRKKKKYVRNLERALFQNWFPSDDEKKRLWSAVIYHNLVLRPMQTEKHRPKYQDYLEGWKIFLRLAGHLKPDQCIVYGLEAPKLRSLRHLLSAESVDYVYKKLPTNIGRNYPKTIQIQLNGHTTKLLFIRHPSAFFSWKRWGSVLANEIVVPRLAGDHQA